MDFSCVKVMSLHEEPRIRMGQRLLPPRGCWRFTCMFYNSHRTPRAVKESFWDAAVGVWGEVEGRKRGKTSSWMTGFPRAFEDRLVPQVRSSKTV